MKGSSIFFSRHLETNIPGEIVSDFQIDCNGSWSCVVRAGDILYPVYIEDIIIKTFLDLPERTKGGDSVII